MELRKLIRKILSEGQFDLDPKYFLQGSYHKDFPDFFDPMFNQNFKDHPYPPALGVTMNQSPLNEEGNEQEGLEQFIGKVKSLQQNYQKKGVDADVSFKMFKSASLDKIFVPKELRGKGLAKSFVDSLTNLADEHGVILTLSPSSYQGSNVNKLKLFYKQFGFRENKGRNADQRFWAAMIREPQPKV